MCSLVTIGIAFAIVVDELRPLMHLSVFVNGKKGVSVTKWIGIQGFVHFRCSITVYSLHGRNL